MKVFGLGGIEIIIILILVFIPWFLSMKLFIDMAKEKGYYEDGDTGILWLTGLFATPIVVGIYAAGLPDKHLRGKAAGTVGYAQSIDDELPSV